MPLISARDFNLNPVRDNSPLAQGIFQAITGVRNDIKQSKLEEAAKLQKVLKTNGAQFLRVRDIGDFHSQRREIARLAQNALKRGEDISVFEQGLSIQDPDELNLFLTREATRAADADKILDKEFARVENEANFQRGSTRFAKDGDGNLFVVSDTFDPNTSDIKGNVTPVGHNKSPVGQLQLVSSAGLTPDEKVEQTGEIAEIKADIGVEAAVDEEGQKLDLRAEKEPEIKKNVKEVELAVAAADKAFDQIDAIQGNILNMRDVIDAIEDGAETGPLASKLPSVREASMRLDNIQKRLGLDVVGSVTFGALSEGELQLALDVALPRNLNGPDLIKWAEEKIAAQEKLKNYLEEQALFLSNGGTRAEWLEKVKSKGKESKPTRIRFDAQGNLIQ